MVYLLAVLMTLWGTNDGKMSLSTSGSGSDSGGEALEEGDAPKNDDWWKTQHNFFFKWNTIQSLRKLITQERAYLNEALVVIIGLFFKFIFIKMKGQINKSNINYDF